MSWGNRGYGGRQNRGRVTFSDAQKRAYYSGQGYKLGQQGKAIKFKNEQNRQSFRNGFKSIDANRYPDVQSNKRG